MEKLKIDMKGWNCVFSLKAGCSENSTRSFQQDLLISKQVLTNMGFIYDVVKVPSDSVQQDPTLALQVDASLLSPFINNIDSMDNENYMKGNFCGHVEDMVGDDGDRGRFGEVADDIFNDVNDDLCAFDDKVFLL